MLNNIYRTEIARLDLLILNWNTLAESDATHHKLGKFDINTNYGLCHNAFLYDLPKHVLDHCFDSHKSFSGSYTFPLGREEWFQDGNKFTVERLRLAKHMRTELMVMGSPKPTNMEAFSDYISELYESKFVCWITVLAIFCLIGYLCAKLV